MMWEFCQYREEHLADITFNSLLENKLNFFGRLRLGGNTGLLNQIGCIEFII